MSRWRAARTTTEAVVHACGHEVSYELYGNAARREGTVAGMVGRRCPGCIRAEKIAQEKVAAAGERHRQAEMGIELPELKGSAKQLDWAADIRAGMVARAISERGRPLAEEDYFSPWILMGPVALEAIASIRDARWFCDRGSRAWDAERRMEAALGAWFCAERGRAVDAFAASVAPVIVERDLLPRIEAEGQGLDVTERIQKVLSRAIARAVGEHRATAYHRDVSPAAAIVAEGWPAARDAFRRALAAAGVDASIGSEFRQV